MNNNKRKIRIAFGGGCHWCTEAVFQSLKGVTKVEQGFVSSTGANDFFSEAVIVHFNREEITLHTLIEIHLYTHKSTSEHSMRKKYRSAIYVYNDKQKQETQEILASIQKDFINKLITKVLQFKDFKPSREQLLNYYYNDPEKPFCKSFIDPKLKLILEKFNDQINLDKLPQATILEKKVKS